MTTEVGKDILRAADLLRKGEIVAVPTETVYGLAGNALDDEAVIRIYEAKQRPRFNPLILHTHSIEAAREFVTQIPPVIKSLADKFSPGPLSYLLTKSTLVPHLVTAGSDKVVIRIPNHPITLELLKLLNFPLAAPSANPFGYVSPVSAEHVFEGLAGRIPYILDGGVSSVGLESTIVGVERDQIIIHRLGGITAEDIRSVTGKTPVFSLLHEKPNTPGQLKLHYAPKTPLRMGDVKNLMALNSGKRIAVISFQNLYGEAYINKLLSPNGDLHEAASNLFSVLRDLDKADVDLIIAEVFPNEGIGMAINDRLGRAVS